jgi:hypothetical protein
MTRQNEAGTFCRDARDARWNIIARDVCMNDLDLVLFYKIRDPFGAEYTE